MVADRVARARGGPAMQTALAPVAAALLASARERAERIRVAGRHQAEDVLAQARAEAEGILAQARADGEAAAARVAASTLAATRREARETVLAARRRAYEAVRRTTLAELVRRRESPAASALIARLTTMARTRLGADATVEALVGDQLGVVAFAGNRRIELTADALVDRELAAFAARLEGLWA